MLGPSSIGGAGRVPGPDLGEILTHLVRTLGSGAQETVSETEWVSLPGFQVCQEPLSLQGFG